MSPLVSFLLISVLTFLFSVLLTRFLIPVLHRKKMGQKILDIGPRWHKSKEGTPTMGGIGFVLPILSLSACFGFFLLRGTRKGELVFFLLTLLFALLNSLIGVLDDLTKFKKHQKHFLNMVK